MKLFSISLLLLGLLAGLAAGEGESPTFEIRLKPVAEIRGADIKLRDVVHSTSISSHTWSRMANTVLGPAPLVGFERYVNREQVLTPFLHEGFDPSQLIVHGPQLVRAFVRQHRIEGSELRIKAENFLREKMEKSGKEDFEIEFAGGVQGILVPRREVPPRFRVRWQGRPTFKGNADVVVQVLDGEQFLSQASLRFKIHAYEEVLVAKKNLPRKSPLQAEDFQPQRVEITGFHKTPFRDLDSLAGRELGRAIGEGEILAMEDTRQPPLVKRGDLVTVIYAHGKLVLTARAKAKESGVKGQAIAVENLDTKRLILATITGPYRVELSLPGR